MAEARIEDDDGDLREQREPSNRRNQRQSSSATDSLERHKPDHRQISQGPLSSIRAAIRRSTSAGTPQSNSPRDRRRPEITILSAEPIATNSWFLGAPGGFTPSPPTLQPAWGGGVPVVGQPPPSYDQVLREKTREQVASLGTSSRRLTSSTATQTDLQSAAVPPGPEVNVMSVSPSKGLEKKRSDLRRPPPRPSFPCNLKPVSRDAVVVPEISQDSAESDRHPETQVLRPEVKNSAFDLNCKFTTEPSTAVPIQRGAGTEPGELCLISLDSPEGNEPLDPPGPPDDCLLQEESVRLVPVPRPRLKQACGNEVKVQTLVRLKDDTGAAELKANREEVATNKYLQELLDVFCPEDQCRPPDGGELKEPGDHGHNMSALRARIQAFEKQSSAGSEDVEAPKPEPRPRVQQPRPPEVAPKPSPAPKPPTKKFWEDGLLPESAVQTDKTTDAAPRSQAPTMTSVEHVNEKQPDRRPSRPPVAPRSRSIGMQNKAGSTEVPAPLGQGAPPVDPTSLDSTSVDTQAGQTNAGSKDANNHAVAVRRSTNPPAVPRKPPQLKFLSRSGRVSEDESPAPPLPVEKPVSGAPPAVPQKPSAAPKVTAAPRSPESSESESVAGFLSENLSPLRTSDKKVPPPRPPPLKGAPGRPPPPRPGPSPPRPDSGPKQVQNHMQLKKGPAPPPRPSPALPLQCKQAKDELLIDLEQDHSSSENQPVGTRSQELPPAVAPPAASNGSDLQLGQAQKDSPLQVEVLHEFAPASPDELLIKLGDTVSMVEQVDSDWYRGTCRGVSGIFPVSHVKVLSNVCSQAVSHTTPASEKKEGPLRPTVRGLKCVARFDFRGTHGDELSLSQGDVIVLKEYVDQEWARGDLDGRVGMFPLNFVEFMEDRLASEAQESANTNSLLKTQDSINVSETGAAGVEWAVALYSFTAQTEEDLSFKQGERILVTQHVDSDWCSGRLDGKEGLFPKAFVQIHSGENFAV